MTSSRFHRNYLWLAAGEFSTKLLMFFAFVHIGRILGPVGLGHVEWIVALVFLFTLISDLGTERLSAVRASHQSPRELLEFVPPLRLILSMAGYAMLLLTLIVINDNVLRFRMAAIFGLGLVPLGLFQKWAFQAAGQMHWVSIANIIRYGIFAVGVLLFLNPQSGPMPVSYWEITGLVIMTAIMFIIQIRQFGIIRWQISFSRFVEFLKSSYPLCLSQLSMALKLYLSILMLGKWMGEESLGIYGASHRIVLALNTFGAIYLFNLLPSLSRAASRKNSDNQYTFEKLMSTSLGNTTGMAILVCLLVSIFAGDLILLVYGSGFKASGEVLQWLVWYILLGIISGHYRLGLVSRGKQNLELWANGAGAVSVVILNLVLIPQWGIPGAVIAMLFSEIVAWGLAAVFMLRMKTHIPFAALVVKPVLAAVLAFGGYFLLRELFWVFSLSGVFAVYFCTWLLLDRGRIKKLMSPL